MSEKLTPEQVEEWHKALKIIAGACASIMTADEIQKLHDQIQAHIDQDEKETK